MIELEDDPNMIANYQSIKELIKKVMVMDKMYRIGRIFEKLILIIGIFYAYLGNKNATALGFHIKLAPGIPVKWKLLHNLLYPFFNPVRIFGLLLIFIGAVVGGILFQHRYYAINVHTIDIFCRAANSLVCAVCMWQFIRIFRDHINWTIQAGNILIIGGIIFIGRLLGDKFPKVEIQKADLNH